MESFRGDYDIILKLLHIDIKTLPLQRMCYILLTVFVSSNRMTVKMYCINSKTEFSVHLTLF